MITILRATCTIAAVLVVAGLRPAFAGPPFVSDDPEPTSYKQFEIYTFNNGTAASGGVSGASGIDFNYGAAPDLQLTATLPFGFDRPAGESLGLGLSNVELAAKYRFFHQDSFGLDVAIFPRVFLPSPSPSVGSSSTSLLLPVWIQEDWGGGWSSFGGGGCVVSSRSSENLCLGGGVLTYQLFPKLQVGGELFHRGADGMGTPASTSVGLGLRYDIDKIFHLLGYVRRGIQSTDQTDRYSWYTSVLFTF